MLKKISAIALIIVIIFSNITLTKAYEAGINIVIDNEFVRFSEDSGFPFVDSASRTQVPFRKTLEQFGCTVSWDQESAIAIAEKEGIEVRVPIGEKYIYQNSEKVANDTEAVIINQRTYIPIRAVLEAFGASVRWDGNRQTLVVDSNELENNLMYIHFIDVGHGDSIFVDYNNFEILIDGGDKASSAKVVEYINDYVDGALDLVVATHEHVDHIGGLAAVLKAYQVTQLIDNGFTADNQIYRDYSAAALAEPNCFYSAVTNTAIDMGRGAILNLMKMDGLYENPNENSIVSMISYEGTKILLTGDIETTAIMNNLNKFCDIDVLKVAHHGSRTSTAEQFLEEVRPEVSIISASDDNTFALPNPNVISKLLNIGSAVYGTFKSGDIVMTTNGSTYSFDKDNRITINDLYSIEVTNYKNLNNVGSSTGEAFIMEKQANFIGNLSSKKFHALNCSAGENIADRNVVYFKTYDDAVSKGYQPCKMCNPL